MPPEGPLGAAMPSCGAELASSRGRLRRLLSSAAGGKLLGSAGAPPIAAVSASPCRRSLGLASVLPPATVAAAAPAGGALHSGMWAGARCSSGRRHCSWQKRRHTWGAAAKHSTEAREWEIDKHAGVCWSQEYAKPSNRQAEQHPHRRLHHNGSGI